ncbi:TIGR00725 family protein [Cryptosporangium phraense]|uniref:TIGR00725 family protein n=1 Tax=Cryptosporangium phraense TaxID=2593070 RepID=A0A545AER8_9ACTN|nr:TIGR00725 family protein [Cryptosporangium phraense]TQS39822.1 TIGR00725 family protein [Cryptosporangium phraense]
MNAPLIGVIGPGDGATASQCALAAEVGTLLARSGAIVVCGGLGGVMEAACRGARSAGGTTIGFLPGTEAADANPYVTIALPTGLGELRNGLIVRAGRAFVAVGGSWGTLSEIALAKRAGKPVYALDGWEIPGLEPAPSPEEAVRRALA